MLQGHTTAIVPCGNPTPKKLPTGGGEWPTFRTARAQRAHSARYAPLGGGGGSGSEGPIDGNGRGSCGSSRLTGNIWRLSRRDGRLACGTERLVCGQERLVVADKSWLGLCQRGWLVVERRWDPAKAERAARNKKDFFAIDCSCKCFVLFGRQVTWYTHVEEILEAQLEPLLFRQCLKRPYQTFYLPNLVTISLTINSPNALAAVCLFHR